MTISRAYNTETDIRNLTIKDSVTTNRYSHFSFVSNKGIIKDILFDNVEATAFASLVFVECKNLVIRNLLAKDFRMRLLYLQHSELEFDNVTVSHMTLKETQIGVLMRIYASSVLIRNSDISFLTLKNNGGVIHTANWDYPKMNYVILENTVFRNNSAV